MGFQSKAFKPAKLDSDQLTERQHVAIACLLRAKSKKEAAEMAEVPERTIHHWLANHQAFRRTLNEAKRAIVQDAVAELSAVSVEAVAVLRDIMVSISQPANSRVSAARAVLDFTVGKNAEDANKKDDAMSLLADLVEIRTP
jgi:hypothetical protein